MKSKPTKPVAEVALEHWPHPGPYVKTWYGCRTCGYHWFPQDERHAPTRCAKCERELDARHRMKGKGVPADTRALTLCKCYRCGYEWFWRKRVPVLPRYCGSVRCTSPYWGWPRELALPRKKPPLTRRVLRSGVADGGLQL